MINIYDLEHRINELSENVIMIKGKTSILESQFIESQEKLEQLIFEKEINTKAIELLDHLQNTTTTIITNMFQDVVTQALQYIHQDDGYKFGLDFGRKGNLPTLDFNILTPDLKEPHDIINTRGGGHCDTTSLGLRSVLIEVSKTDGFLFLDEPFKMLDNDETIQKGMEFIKELQKNTGRQFIIITHKKIITDNETGIVWM